MKTTPLKIGGRTFALYFNLNAMAALEASIPDFDLRKLTEYAKTTSGLLDLIVAMATEGEAVEGRTMDVDREWIGRHLRPSPKKIADVKTAVFNALTDGMAIETEDDEDGEYDEVLEEIKKKEPTGSSPAGG